MGLITLQQAAQWCGGCVNEKYKDVAFLGANNDTRKIEKGQLFVALQGVRDGHDFIDMAREKGAAAVLCTRCEQDIPAIVVPDTRIALGQIAAGERQRIGMKVVGVTGSVGKSTTKEMIVSVLESTYRVAKTPANHNNDIGMPMAVLAIPEDTQVAVLEMGMNHFREIAYLTDIAKPDVGVIINIGTMHIEHLGSRDGILQAKLEILEGMSENGCIVLNGDDDKLWNQDKTKNMKTVFFGSKNQKCGLCATHVRQDGAWLSYEANGIPVELPLEGEHYVLDSLAAVAVGLELGVTPEKITESLAAFRNMAGRQEIFDFNGMTIIQDCYNAGPESMAAALSVLGNRGGQRIAVLGDMLELGERAPLEHEKVGALAAQKAEILLSFGPNSEKMVAGAVAAGMTNAWAFTERAELTAALKQLAKPGDTILFKGSRGMRMELILEQFVAKVEDK